MKPCWTSTEISRGAEQPPASGAHATSDSQQAEFRTWSDITGKFQTEAAFVDFKEGKVRLKKKGGSIVSVPIEKFSRADQEWVKQQSAATQSPPDKQWCSGNIWCRWKPLR